MTFDAAKNGWQQLTENSWGLYTANGLNGMGLIGPRPVRCITAAIQLRHHLGYEWGEKEIGDISRLHDRFGLPLPPDLAHPVATSPHVRPARQEHQAFLERMLLLVIRWQHEASNVEGNDQSALDERALRYVEDWGRPGDLGFIAATADEKLGAAWCRYFDPDRPGYGYMDQDVPELSIAVARPHRGTGIGTALMRALIDKVIERGDRGVTSSIEDGNPARRLYERLGFRTVRRDVGARVMLLDITPTFSDEP
ncbi:MAG TPA: GNAT family N-acetyltransferase [Actinomycetota bacterium]|nr:GNAT family N-acetyltransferase [Actinomycetota bacterium]